MKKIGLVVDEGADLPSEITKRYQVKVVPFKIDLGAIKNIPGNVFHKIREGDKRGLNAFVKTSQPSPKDFFDAFKEQLTKFEKIICLTISSKVSGTFNSAIQAKNFLEEEFQKKVFVVDSLTGTAGEGLLATKIIKFAEKDLKIEEILNKIEEIIPKIRTIGAIEDPKWLDATGRLSHSAAVWIRRLQKIGIRPLVGIKKGKIRPIGIKFMAKGMAESLFKDFKSYIKNNQKEIEVVITHADNLPEAEKLKEMIKKFKNVKIIFVGFVDNVVGGVIGPGTLVLAWYPFTS